jgi:ribosomal protein S18 acetylase RimI-like enzyme
MRAICLHDKSRLAAFLRRNPALYLYLIGDLDEFFWPYTQWYGLEEGGELREVALLYAGTSLPVLLALSEDPPAMSELLRGVLHLLPSRMYSHLSPGVLGALEGRYTAEPHGEHLRMTLADTARTLAVDTSRAVRLGTDDLEEVLEFYRAAYPDGWFDPRMLETGQYFGVRQGGELASVAGIHVYSPEYGVTAIGNVATLPTRRGHGLATVATGALCRALLEHTPSVGLNVSATNAAAVACYRKLGFVTEASYSEYMLNDER